MGNKPLLSVIIPAYNVEKHILALLESLKRQAPENFEIIMIDDGSMDKTVELSNAFIKKNPQIDITLKPIENQGVSHARNMGIELAKGEFIMFLDSDDLVGDDFAFAVQEAIEKNCDLTVANFSNIRVVEGKTICNGPKQPLVYQGRREISELLNAISVADTEWLLNVLWNKVFKASIIKKHNLSFLTICPGEDMEFVCRYLACCESMFLTCSLIYNYYSRDGSSLVNRFYSIESQLARRNAICGALEDLYVIYDIYENNKEILNVTEGKAVYALLHTSSKLKKRKERINFIHQLCQYQRYGYINSYLESKYSLKNKFEYHVFKSQNPFLIDTYISFKTQLSQFR